MRAYFAAAAAVFLAFPAFAAGNNLSMTSPVYGTTGQEFGTGDLSGGYGVNSLKVTNAAIYTMEAWVYLTAAPSSTRVAIGADGIGWIGVATNGDFAYALGTGSQVTSSVSIVNSQWHLLDLVQNNGVGIVYVDGNQVASTSDTTSADTGGIGVGTYVYQGTVNTQFQWTGLIDETSIWNTARYSASFTPQTSPYTGNETGLVALYHLDGNGNDSSTIITTALAPNNAAFYYSPANWLVSSTSAETNSDGAYMRFYYSGSTPPTFNFNTSNDTATPVANLAISIDGQPAQEFSLASSITPTAPNATNSVPIHFLDLSVMYIPENENEWQASARPGTPVLSSVTLPSSETVSAYTPLPYTTLLFGDSIFEGLKTLGVSSPYTDAVEAPITDGTKSAPFLIGRDLFGTEVGEIADGGQWISPSDPQTQGAAAGSVSDGSWPPLPDSLSYLWSGQVRTWPTNVRYILVGEGTNDSGKGGNCTGIVEGVTRTVGLLRQYEPSAQILFIEPYIYNTNGGETTFQTCEDNAVTASGATLIKTAGMLNTALTSEGVHPLVSMNRILLSDLAAPIEAALPPAKPYVFR